MANVPIPDDLLDDIFNANATAGGVYLDRYGRYVLLVEQAMYKQIRDVGRCFITKFQVLKSEPLSVQEPASKAQPESRTVAEEPHPPGYRPSVAINWDGDAKLSADGNAKAIVLGIFGMNEASVPKDVFKATFKDMVSDAQPARGMVVQAEVRPKGVGKQDGVFSHHIRLPYWHGLGVPGQGENTHELIRARRAEIEKYIGAETERDARRDADRDQRLVAAGSSILPQNGAPSPSASPPSIQQAADPLAGWQIHPQNKPGDPDPFYWKGSVYKRRSEILAG